MEEGVLYDTGGRLQIRDSGKAPVLVPFPVCLAVKYGGELVETCADFVLNREGSQVFVRTGSPLPAGTSLMLHFYIPPETKLLAEVRGKVIPIAASGPPLASGMLIRLAWPSRRKLKLLERYIKGERHLVDRTA